MILVVGLPRSGTSLTCQLITLMGYNPGPDWLLKKGDSNNKNGYYECLPLQYVSRFILWCEGTSFFKTPPNEINVKKYFFIKFIVRTFVRIFGINVLKDNTVMYCPEVYAYFFPNIKVVYSIRDINSTYKSRFGGEIAFSDWEDLTSKRRDRFEKSTLFSKAFMVEYEKYKLSTEQLAGLIKFLDKDLSLLNKLSKIIK